MNYILKYFIRMIDGADAHAESVKTCADGWVLCMGVRFTNGYEILPSVRFNNDNVMYILEMCEPIVEVVNET